MNKLLPSENRSAILLASIFGIRTFGLFILLPILTLYLGHFEGATPFLMGMALGIYGFSSGIFQIVWGMLSDRLGRKPTITIALLIFALGSLLAGRSTSIDGLILGRFLQGMGASGSSILALLSDLTRPESRVKAMGFVGMMIGVSFMVSVMLGPWFVSVLNLSGIFFLTAGLAVFALVILWSAVPDPKSVVFHPEQELSLSTFWSVLKQKTLQRLFLGVFILHLILMGFFVAFPSYLMHEWMMTLSSQRWIYLIAVPIAFVVMIPLMILAEKKGKIKNATQVGVMGLALSALFMSLGHFFGKGFSALSLTLFLTGFVTLEALLPSWLSKIAPLEARGTAFGLYASFQFFGAFLGGCLGGWFQGFLSSEWVFLLVLILSLFWLLMTATMPEPPQSLTKILSIPTLESSNFRQILTELKNLPGVLAVQLNEQERSAYLRVDRQKESEFHLTSEEIISKWQKEPSTKLF